MPVAWFVVPYKRDRRFVNVPTRYAEIADYTDAIRAAGGQWAGTEILGHYCLVKVRASTAIITALSGEYTRLPKSKLSTSLADLTPAQKQALRNLILNLGYTAAEVRTRFGDDLGQYTLGDVLRFMATRRLKPRYDAESDIIILDGAIQACRPVIEVDREIVE